MTAHLRTAVDKLKKLILGLGALVEESVDESVQSILERNESLAKNVIDTDNDIDKLEVDLEEECLKVLALYQPVAIDLRFIISVLKINNDLERIGDLAVNIAERGEFIATHDPVEIPFDLKGMADDARTMLRKSLDALVNTDADTAYGVLQLDERVDAVNREMYHLVIAAIRKEPDKIETFLNLLSVSRYLERIADHATNISEDIIYMLHGDIVRHKEGRETTQAE